MHFSRNLFIFVFAFLLLVSSRAPGYAAFNAEIIEGWSVYFDTDMATAMPDVTQRMRTELRSKLHEITLRLPARRVEELRRVPILVSAAQGKVLGSGAHYSSGGGEESEGGDVDGGMAFGAVILDNPAAVLEWLQKVPSGILHELAHAYHGQVLGLDDPAIIAAYRHAVENHLYENVQRLNGAVVARSYALTNKSEYFALLTQAYFWTSGFYPFNRDELKTYDPVGYETVRAAWEDRPGPQPDEEIRLESRCERIGVIDRAPSQTKAVLGIRNGTGTSLSVFWFDNNGRKVPYPGVMPHGFRAQITRAGRKWEIDANDACVAVVTVDGRGDHVDIVQ